MLNSHVHSHRLESIGSMPEVKLESHPGWVAASVRPLSLKFAAKPDPLWLPVMHRAHDTHPTFFVRALERNLVSHPPQPLNALHS